MNVDGLAVVSWLPSAEAEQHRVPGSEFFVDYNELGKHTFGCHGLRSNLLSQTEKQCCRSVRRDLESGLELYSFLCAQSER